VEAAQVGARVGLLFEDADGDRDLTVGACGQRGAEEREYPTVAEVGDGAELAGVRGALLLAAVLVVALARRIGLPPVLGYLIVGVLVGP
jgi:hypothetical protein